MSNRRLYKCPRCSMIYWGHELMPDAESFPVSFRGKCPTPGCSGYGLFGQASPSEAGLFDGLIGSLPALAMLHWVFRLGWPIAAVGRLVVGALITLISSRWHRPKLPHEDERFAADQLVRHGEGLGNQGNWRGARAAFERAMAILGTEADSKLEGAILGRLANAEKHLGDFGIALKHYDQAIALAEKSDDISGLINRLHNRAALLGDDLHNPSDAISYLEMALEQARKLPDKQKLHMVLTQLAKRTREAGRHAEARKYAGEVVRLAEGPVMTDSKMLAQALYERACISLAEKHNTAAAEDLKKAVRVLGTGSDSELRRLLTLALQTVEAAISQQGTVSILPPGSAKPSDESGLVTKIGDEAMNILNAAMEHMMADRLVAAAAEFRQALNSECIRSNPAATAVAQANLGDILRTLGETDEAVEILEHAVESARLAKDSYLEHIAQLNLGIAQHEKGSWAESRSNLERALDLAPDAAESAGRGRALVALANVYRDSAEYERAENMFREAARLSDQSSDKELPGAIEQNWGNLYFVQGQRHSDETIRRRHWHEAIPHYEKALTLARERRDGRSQGIALHMLGNIHRRLGDPKHAIELLQQSLAIEDVCPSEVSRAGRLNDLATAEQDYGQVPQAIEHYHQAVQLFRKHGIASPDVAGCLENLGVLLVRCGKIEEGRDIIFEASRMDNLMIAQAFAIASETARLEFLAQAEGRLSDIISLVATGGPLEDNAPTIRACADVVIRRKGATLDALSLQRDLVASRRHPELAAAIKELSQIRMTVAHMILAGKGRHGDGSPTPKAAELAARQSRLEHEITKYTPFIMLDEQLGRADAKAAKDCLPKESALVEFMRFKRFDFPPPDRKPYWVDYRYAAFILRPDEANDIQVVDLGEAEAIDQMIVDFIQAIDPDPDKKRGRSSRRGSRITDIGMKLRRTVFDPVAHVLEPCQRLLIAPDSGLTRLPFEVLPTEDGRYVIDEYSISYLSAGRDLLRFKIRTQGEVDPPVVIADPDFDLSDGMPCIGKDVEERASRCSRHLGDALEDEELGPLEFSPLPNSAEEGKLIGEMLGVQPWLGKAALESTLKSCTSPRILHMATHGFFLNDQEWRKMIGVHTDFRQPSEAVVESPLLRSGIALAGANTFLRSLRDKEPFAAPPPAAEDGILTAEDVTGLDLFSTELVVLSACRTGVGVSRTGEGVFGLRRAFVQAGARALVMSLWRVPDKATMELMVGFYRRLLADKGKGRAEALREAQMAVRDQYPAPRFWGAFICQGDPSAMGGIEGVRYGWHGDRP